MNLEEELQQCRQYAEEGYQLAIHQYNEIKDTIKDVSKSIDSADREQNQMSRIKNTQLLEQQQQSLNELATYVDKIHDDIEMLKERQKDFTIIVYGRTMAGKSTLMEILTHGNGKSIGRGAQRTTLDVRSYFWKGLKIFDVPGICSFGGAEDDKLAFEAAKSADLILFLLTDDAPQPDEAEALARLKSLGKPVLGIVNVKMAFDMNRKKISLRNLEKKLADTERIDTICDQFKQFAVNHNQNWSEIPFVYTHLNAAFQSQVGRGNDEEVYKASNFPQVESFILDKVKNDGKFLRMKTFIDIAAVPMQRIIAAIYERSAETLKESSLYQDKVRQFASWRQKFEERSQQRLTLFYNDLKSQIDNEIYHFSNANYENENAGKDWEKVIERMNLPQKCQDTLNELAGECERKRRELSDLLTQELKFSIKSNTKTKNIEMGGVMPWGKIAFQVGVNALMFVPGIGWAARIGIGIGGALLSFLFDNKEDKIRENKEKLRKQLRDGTYPMLDNMRSKVEETFKNEILKKGIYDFIDVLYEMSYMLARLGKAQYELANELSKKYYNLNLELLQVAIEYSRQPGLLSSVEHIARIPGEEFFVAAGRCSIDTKTVSALLGEHLSIVKATDELEDIVKLILGCEFNIKEFSTFINEKVKAFVVSDISVNKTNFTLAQQIAGVPILD